MIKTYTTEELRTFAFCSMQHHLRYRLGLPWFEASSGVAYTTLLRKSVYGFSRSLMANGSLTASGRFAANIISDGVKKISRAFPKIRLHSKGARFWVAAAVRTLVAYVSKDFEYAIGYGIPVSTPISLPGTPPFQVSGIIDAAFMKKDHAMIAHLQESPKCLPARPSWDAFDFGVAVSSSYELEEDVQHLVVPGGPVPVRANDLRDFQLAATSVVRGIEAAVAIPQGNRTRCDTCPYVSVCSPSLSAGDAANRKDELVARINQTAEINEFARESIEELNWIDSVVPNTERQSENKIQISRTILDEATLRPILKVPPDPTDQPAYGSIPSRPGQGAETEGGTPPEPDDVEVLGEQS